MTALMVIDYRNVEREYLYCVRLMVLFLTALLTVCCTK